VISEVVPRHRARGAGYPISDEWRQQVLAKMAEKGWDRTKLAEEAGIAPSTITETLTIGGKQKTSKHAARLHAALGMPPPKPLGAAQVDPVRAEIDNGLDVLDPQGLDAVLQVIRRMRPSGGKGQ
jgi:lambda repressor-like predicted transcriptional regulator